jgi:ATP-dependent protease HslVU (ClpYQ) ATPase subunit
MNQTQRKYFNERVHQILNRKRQEINQEFARKYGPRPNVPQANQAGDHEIIKALIGMPSRATLRPIEEMQAIAATKAAGYLRLNDIALPPNIVEIDVAQKALSHWSTAFETQVNDNVNKMVLIANQVSDTIMIKDNEEVLAAVEAFDRLTAATLVQ